MVVVVGLSVDDVLGDVVVVVVVDERMIMVGSYSLSRNRRLLGLGRGWEVVLLSLSRRWYYFVSWKMFGKVSVVGGRVGMLPVRKLKCVMLNRQ